MKKTSIRLVLAMAFSALLFGACKKDKDGESVALTKENLAGTYKLTKAKYTISGIGEVDALADLEACEKDDTYTLKTDFTATRNDAGTKCNPETTGNTNWTLADGSIVIDDFGGKVKSFDGTTLLIEGSETQQGITASYSIIFVKQ